MLVRALQEFRLGIYGLVWSSRAFVETGKPPSQAMAARTTKDRKSLCMESRGCVCQPTPEGKVRFKLQDMTPPRRTTLPYRWLLSFLFRVRGVETFRAFG